MTFIPMQGKCPHCGRDDCMPALTTLNKRIAELEQELLEERASYEAERQRLRDMLESAWERMDRAREILTDGKPSKHNNWGMLDTTLDRQALEKDR